MLHCEQIEHCDLVQYISKAFEGDHVLLNSIHINPGTLNSCAEHTYHNITDNGTEKLKFWRIELEFSKTDIGFMVTSHDPNILHSFGLNIQYRTKEIKQAWLDKLSEIFIKTAEIHYVVVLHDKNKRAIRFFEKNKFHVKYFHEDKIVGLWL